MAANSPYRDRPYRRTLISVGVAVGAHVIVLGTAGWFFKDYIVKAATGTTQTRVTQRTLEDAVAETPFVTPGFTGIQGTMDPNYSFDQVPSSDGWDTVRFLQATDASLPSDNTWLADRSMMNAMPASPSVTGRFGN